MSGMGSTAADTNLTLNSTTVSSAYLASLQQEAARLQTIRDALNILIQVLIVVINLGMGMTVDYKTVLQILKKPVGPVIGVICQFAIMPLLAFILTLIFQMGELQTIALLLVGSCPGGTSSNVGALWLGGDMDLSITMTTISSTLAFGMMPLLLLIYSQAYGGTLSVPFEAIGISLALAVPPILVGILFRSKFPKKAVPISKVLSVLGSIAIITSIVVQIVVFREYFQLTWKQWVVATLFSPLGLSLGFIVATLVSCWKPLHLTLPQRKTISLETGVQNIAIAVAIINLAGYTRAETGQIVLFPVIVMMFQLIIGSILIAIYQSHLKIKQKKLQAEENNEKETGDSQMEEESQRRNENGNAAVNEAYLDDETIQKL